MARPSSRPRDQRLDLFRGLTMLIIFVAHVPDNPWGDWIPARFGFSSGTELFVFCSGVASALAFSGVFETRGLAMGTARIAWRCWQVYWAHAGLFLASVALAAALDRLTGSSHIVATQFAPLLADPGGAILAFLTLRWLPQYLDILPMYLVILAMVPAVMGLRRLHPALPFVLVAGLYATVWLRGLELDGDPLTHDPWFLNPFSWQAVFFLGFFFAKGWIKVPPLRRPVLVAIAVAGLLFTVPVAHKAVYGSLQWALDVRVAILPLNEKADLHWLRILHFLLLAYVALSLVEPSRTSLDAHPAGRLLVRIGRQSLGTFLASLLLARAAGVVLDIEGRGAGPAAAVNLAGLALVVVAALTVEWFKSAPWSKPHKHPDTQPAQAAAPGPSSVPEPTTA
ncbi:OpgC family protein [uncultured Alsobacter sp.]|uniref:OpgC family protein n=1 Tax=uncultured Alsobacter sp. TaxID=1748258 RepID=UPI0025E729C8|nr:OpgC domain-containing protein [uncultured Alsobacter sp.]